MTSTLTWAGIHRPGGWRRKLALSPDLVDFARRGFRTDRPQTRTVLERAATAFLDGYNRGLDTPYGQPTILDGLPAELRGFRAEGAAMSAVLLDRLSPTRHGRFAVQLRAHPRHHYLLHVGAGWALAKLDTVSAGTLGRLGRLGSESGLLRWLAYDGYGFFKVFFLRDPTLARWRRHPAPCDPTCAIRYQGLGRSLWFRECGDPAAVAGRIAGMPAVHRGDVWSGVGLAATYANGVSPDDHALLRRLAGDHRAALAQGAAFAAEARRADGTAGPAVDATARILTGASADTAAEWTWQARHGLGRADATPADYGEWRTRVQRIAASHGAR
ncbi:DUF1702 family protein [Salinispora sp. H7-4]|uniref:DUF1702 family protein n=1 Tax=Salinispora sp. H7-4 TaxID=2748321 RepID=UPI0015D1D020|nr:DUF1702 family protein [Salinispora sp. H7-4]NYT95316.1 DUF1702 family protein [Salinispora sp. H7-4]